MENGKKSSGVLIGILIGLIIAIIVVGCLFATRIIGFKTNVTTNNEKVSENDKDITPNKTTGDEQQSENNNGKFILNNLGVNEVTYNNKKISVFDMVHETIHIEDEFYRFYADLNLSGKVKIKTIGMSSENNTLFREEYLSNISNAVDIIQFNVPSIARDQYVYILLDNGDVYYYIIGDSVDKKYTATKVKNVSNVKQLFIYNYPIERNTGGRWSIVAIKDNNETVSLNSEGV